MIKSGAGLQQLSSKVVKTVAPHTPHGVVISGNIKNGTMSGFIRVPIVDKRTAGGSTITVTKNPGPASGHTIAGPPSILL